MRNRERSNEQKLIDIMFEIGLKIHTHKWFKDKNNEEVCEWIRSQLADCGFDTIPCGSSWGFLISINGRSLNDKSIK